MHMDEGAKSIQQLVLLSLPGAATVSAYILPLINKTHLAAKKAGKCSVYSRQ